MMSAESLLYSPRGVADMRVFEVDGDKLDCLRTPFSSCAEAEDDAVPPVSSLSISDASSEDSGSVSSVSLDDEDDRAWDESVSSGKKTPEKRTLFAAYWNKKGGRPKPLHVESCSVTEDLTVVSCDSDDSSSSSSSTASFENSYEKLLQKNEAAPARRNNGSGMRRRRLWNNVYTQSEPSLSICALETKPSCIRKTQSTTEVEGERRPSILRASKYSGAGVSDDTPRTSSERTSVSFSEEVRVEYLKPETEKWAAKGWSKYFM